jgi:hypothetical protein
MSKSPADPYAGAVTFSFGDNPALADELLALVLAGRKTATCGALPVKSTLARSPLTLTLTLMMQGASLTPSSSSASSAAYTPSGIALIAARIIRAE